MVWSRDLIRIGLVSVVAFGLLAACGGDPDDSHGAQGTSGGGSTSTNDDLRPADEVLAENEAAEAHQFIFGQSATLIEGLTVTIDRPALYDDDTSAALLLDVRVENGTERTLAMPTIELFCAGSTKDGDNLAVLEDEDLLDTNGQLPPDTFVEGHVYALVPGDSRITGDESPDCTSPALIRVKARDESFQSLSDAATADFKIDASLLASLLAAL